MVSAFSPNEATDFVTKTNNFLIQNEVPVILSPIVMIEYLENKYWVVTGMSGTTVNIYIPINTETREVASGSIEIRDLIQTVIVLNRIFELKNTYPVSDWPFSITNKTNFETLQNKFNEKIASITTIETNFSTIDGAEKIVEDAKSVKNLLEKLSTHSKEISNLIEEGINFEKIFFNSPNTKETSNYEKIFSNYFEELNNYKQDFEILKTNVDSLRNNIGSLQSEEINASQKEFYNSIAKLPNEVILLNNVFSRANETQTFTQEIFNSTKNIENFVLNLETRRQRNEAWKAIYGNDEDIRKINPAINSLEEAAEIILDEANVNYWKNQDSISALKINWRQTQEKYNNGIYTSAIEFAKSAKNNVLNILEDDFIEIEDELPTELIINIIIILIVLIIGIFLFEKFYLKKKKEVDNDENYEENY
ncbi:MAG: hypothetical protein PHP82_04255 [Candidatus ainarchaeum sp.]|nr:hypothetical protein [Candidatus ainarchaeum sp.]